MGLTPPASGVTEKTTDRTTGEDRRANELTDALAALPTGHPARPSLRRQAIEAWSPMAQRLARRYARRGESMDDLTQTATIGLIKAIDRFDTSHGVDFVAFAIPTILGELKKHFRDRTWTIRVPRRLQEMRMVISAANGTLIHSLGRNPTLAEIAAHLEVSEEEVIEGLEGARAYRPASLSAPTNAEGTLELGDTIASNEHGYELTEVRLSLEPALRHLSERERRVLTLRFYGNQTQTEIAEQIGVSQMHISRIIAHALAKLRQELSPDGR